MTGLDALITELDTEITNAGVRGTVTTDPKRGKEQARRSRSTRRRQDAPDLPRRKIEPAPPAGCTPPRTANATGRPCSSR